MLKNNILLGELGDLNEDYSCFLELNNSENNK